MIIGDVFYEPFRVTWIRVTRGSTDQATGEWNTPTTTTKVIDGHIQDDLTGKISKTNSIERRRDDPGNRTVGSRAFRTQERLRPGDQIQITEYTGKITTWRVTGIGSGYPLYDSLMGINWTEYTLQFIR